MENEQLFYEIMRLLDKNYTGKKGIEIVPLISELFANLIAGITNSLFEGKDQSSLMTKFEYVTKLSDHAKSLIPNQKEIKWQ